ncbi:MAG TPA: hypothetical protein PLX16_04740, partial [Exilispira sp.]|nr:hypothetical protein [Exilispira sp.]
FEAKTGDYQRYVAKYSKVADIMGLDNNHRYMILTDVTDSATSAVSSLFNMTVVRIDNFYSNFLKIMKIFKEYIPAKDIETQSDQQENLPDEGITII